MKILIVGLTKGIQFERLSEEGKKRGHEVLGSLSSDLIIDTSTNEFKPILTGHDLSSYNLVYSLTSKRRWEWYTAFLYLAEKYKTIIVNKKVIDPTYNYFLTPAIDYLRQTQNNFQYPRSFLFFSIKFLDNFSGEFKFPIIIKRSDGRKGKGVFKANDMNELKARASEILKSSLSFVVREFIPNDGDIRVFCVGYRAVGAMKRTPKIGEFRSNISQGGMGSNFDLNSRADVRELAESVAAVVRTQIAGVDIMINKETDKPYILEVNPAPQFEGLEKYTSVNAALEIIKYFETLQSS
ncbi:ATP-grasp domain-containing protein [Candidatus Woesebacteria bacterium]|nr:ATP-grasp domain-containing protein [Candidatus Woesebacteria bacterium]